MEPLFMVFAWLIFASSSWYLEIVRVKRSLSFVDTRFTIYKRYPIVTGNAVRESNVVDWKKFRRMEKILYQPCLLTLGSSNWLSE